MNRQTGMSLLEVLLAMSIFAAVALTLMSSMQGQTNAMKRMHDQTLALWIADSLLQQESNDDSAVSEGEIEMAQQRWQWHREKHPSPETAIGEITVTVTLPDGQQTSLTRYYREDEKAEKKADE